MAAIVTRFPVKDSRNRLIAVERHRSTLQSRSHTTWFTTPSREGNVWLMIKGRWTSARVREVILAGQRFSSRHSDLIFNPIVLSPPRRRNKSRGEKGVERDDSAMSENDRLLGLLLSGYATSTKTSRLSSLSTKPSVTPKCSCEGVGTMRGRRRGADTCVRRALRVSPCSPCLCVNARVWTLAVRQYVRYDRDKSEIARQV